MRIDEKDVAGLAEYLQEQYDKGCSLISYFDEEDFFRVDDLNAFDNQFEALEYGYENTTDRDHCELAPLLPVLEAVHHLQNAFGSSGAQQGNRSLPFEVWQIVQDYNYKQELKTKIMEIENVKIEELTPLAKTFKYAGMGKISNEELNQKMAEGGDTFKIGFIQEFKEGVAKVSAVCTKAKDGKYYADNYDLSVSQEGKPDLQRNYKFRGRIPVTTILSDGTEKTEKVNPTLTLKEAFNQMLGRGVHKTFVSVDLNEPKNNRKYDATEYIDFTQADAKGNYRTTKFFDLDIDKKLKSYDLVENKDPDNFRSLSDSLKRGNIQSAKYISLDGSQENIYLMANARHNTINAFDKDMNAISLQEKRQQELKVMEQKKQAETKTEDKKEGQQEQEKQAETKTEDKKEGQQEQEKQDGPAEKKSTARKLRA